jgi:thiosulfate/3-mercaptopyruvate sulfurtransferase
LESYEKIYVNPSFLESEHGEIACENCHGGDPNDPNWQTAHKGIIKDSTFPTAEKTCGECHQEITATAEKSLHYTLAPFTETIKTRANKKDAKILHAVMEAKDKHCASCHSSCGQCHISRPDYVDGGFLGGHLFQKKPPMDTTCASCHGGRVYAEFTGGNDGYPGDVHYDKEEMTCMDCHTAAEMHADATGVMTRLDLPQRPHCRKCHADAVSEKAKIKSHLTHRDKVACQVCHAVASKNCFSCHVGTDTKGLPYYKCEETLMLYRVGLNPNRSPQRPYEYVVLRHPPVNPRLFDAYVKNALTDIDKLPTWKTATPHNIQRITPQNRACNNCHGKGELFLQIKDLPDWEKKANARVVVPEGKIPKTIEEGP